MLMNRHPQTVSMGDLTQPLICHMATWVRERDPCPSPPTPGWRAGPEVMRVRELALPLTNSSPGGVDVCESAPRA